MFPLSSSLRSSIAPVALFALLYRSCPHRATTSTKQPSCDFPFQSIPLQATTMMILQRFLICILSSLVTIATDAKLRGVNNNNFEDLKRRLKNPILRSDVQGKTVRELGVLKGGDIDIPTQQKDTVVDEDKKKRRSLQDSGTGRAQEFFVVYDEFGPPISLIGQTAGLNGLIYNMERYASGGQLTAEDVIGALKGSCSVVGSNNEQFCTYEVLIAEEDGSTFGSVISSGVVDYKQGGGGFLIVEAAGDAYAEYRGGVMRLMYQTIGVQTILTGELSLA